MFAITGITGRVGGETANALLASGRRVRAVLRDRAKARAWEARGCEIAIADIRDAAALTAAFGGAEAVFVLLPPMFDPAPDFAEARATIAAVQAALAAARPSRVVCLSTIGAQSARSNLLSQLTLMERTLGDSPIPTAFLRPAWFIENSAWDVAPARDDGRIASFLQPLERAFPMVASADIGRAAAALLEAAAISGRILELEGPRRISPNDIAATFARLLGRGVRAEAVPRTAWEAQFRAQGMKHPTPRMQMLDGFNEGWIEFERPTQVVRGTTTLEQVLQRLIAAA